MRSANTGFGGPWTEEKLDILKKYLYAYTTALKNQPFRLIYIDAFAGTGEVELTSADEGKKEFIEGSARIAVDVDDKPFDEYIFIEKDQDRCIQLNSLKGANQCKNIQMKVGETCTALILNAAYLEMKNSSAKKGSIDLLKHTGANWTNCSVTDFSIDPER